MLSAAILATSALAACGADVVNGAGKALSPSTAPTTSTGSTADTPAPTDSDSGFPSDTSSASTSATPTPSPTGGTDSLAPGTPTAGGLSISYPAGHLRATFPTQPVAQSVPSSAAGTNVVTHLAVSHDPVPVEAASEDIGTAIPNSGYQTTMQAAFGSFGGSSGLTVDTQSATTFRGLTAREGTLHGDGGQYRLLIFFANPKRLYILFAAQGAPFDNLTSTFAILP